MPFTTEDGMADGVADKQMKIVGVRADRLADWGCKGRGRVHLNFLGYLEPGWLDFCNKNLAVIAV